VSPARCCGVASDIGARHSTRRLAEAAGPALSGTLLVLLPKCPACLAAWIAAGTGIALPAALAGGLRMALVVLCVWMVSWASWRALARGVRHLRQQKWHG